MIHFNGLRSASKIVKNKSIVLKGTLDLKFI